MPQMNKISIQLNGTWAALNQRIEIKDDGKTKLARVLNLTELTALSVGTTLGVGVYVLAGSVAYTDAGPAVILSFLIAAIASAMAAVCYAEFAARVPKAGSAYVYAYVSIGEFIAFLIGWNLILEYIIGTSSVARAFVNYIDALFGCPIENFLRDHFPMNNAFFAEYPDLFSFIIIMLLAFLLAAGVKQSSQLHLFMTIFNLSTILIVIVSGIAYANPSNWSIQKEDIPDWLGAGEGGFMPYGFAGVMSGASKCFYAFVGFDVLATAGEEAKNPKRNVPLAIFLSFIIICVTYFGVSAVLTLMLPYYLQNPMAPFPHVYSELDLIVIRWIVTIGAVSALGTSLLGGLFPLPRILYSMSSDGLLYSVFKRVNKRTKTPVWATLISSAISAVLALVFNLQQLIDMLAIGTLLAYSIVAVCVLVLRYRDEDAPQTPLARTHFSAIFNMNNLKHPTNLSSTIVNVSVILLSVLMSITCYLLKTDWDHFTVNHKIILVLIIPMVMLYLIIVRQPKSKCDLRIKVPLVPLLPLVSVFMNIYLMCQLSISTWIRFCIWIVIGFLIYFTHGMGSALTQTYCELKRTEPEHNKESNDGN